MHSTNILLRIQKFKRKVINQQNKSITKNIVFPLFEGTHEGVQFLFVGTPILS